MRTRRLALCQVKTRADRQTTLLAAETMVRQAAEAGADLPASEKRPLPGGGIGRLRGC